VAVPSATEFVEKLRPAGGRRSGKRDFIVNVFLRQEGHIGADQLVDLIRKEDPGISRATIYRTLQWMEDAGIARRVDFGDGKFKFEHTYRHPRLFHLICQSCHESFEFLSSDIESSIEEVASARGFTPDKSVLQIYGTCQACASGERSSAPAVPTDAVFARDALRMAVATERSGRNFYIRAAKMAKDKRAREVFEKLGLEEVDHLEKLEARYQQLLSENPALESQPTFLFFKGAANGLFATGTEELAKASDDRQALLIGIRCERGSHKFFKKYGERFEESEGRRVFLEFADEEREHLELLVREYKDLIARQTAAKAKTKKSRSR